jgi:hypothetical protein
VNKVRKQLSCRKNSALKLSNRHNETVWNDKPYINVLKSPINVPINYITPVPPATQAGIKSTLIRLPDRLLDHYRKDLKINVGYVGDDTLNKYISEQLSKNPDEDLKYTLEKWKDQIEEYKPFLNTKFIAAHKRKGLTALGGGDIYYLAPLTHHRNLFLDPHLVMGHELGHHIWDLYNKKDPNHVETNNMNRASDIENVVLFPKSHLYKPEDYGDENFAEMFGYFLHNMAKKGYSKEQFPLALNGFVQKIKDKGKPLFARAFNGLIQKVMAGN